MTIKQLHHLVSTKGVSAPKVRIDLKKSLGKHFPGLFPWTLEGVAKSVKFCAPGNQDVGTIDLYNSEYPGGRRLYFVADMDNIEVL